MKQGLPCDDEESEREHPAAAEVEDAEMQEEHQSEESAYHTAQNESPVNVLVHLPEVSTLPLAHSESNPSARVLRNRRPSLICAGAPRVKARFGSLDALI